MAADGASSVSLEIVYGVRKFQICLTLPPRQHGDVLTVKHLANAVERLCAVPVQRQRLSTRLHTPLGGRYTTRLTDLNQPLSQIGIRDGSRIIVFGQPSISNTPEFQGLEKLKGLEKRFDGVDGELSRLADRLNRLEYSRLHDKRNYWRMQRPHTAQHFDPVNEIIRESHKLAPICNELGWMAGEVDCLPRLERGYNHGYQHRKAGLKNQIKGRVENCGKIATGVASMKVARSMTSMW